jgi:hypothetical protein
VRHGPKGVDEGALGSSPKGREMAVRWCEDDAAAAVRSGGCGTQGRGERGRRVTGCSGALVREDERGKKGGRGGDGAPFIGDAAGVGDADERTRHSNRRRV